MALIPTNDENFERNGYERGCKKIMDVRKKGKCKVEFIQPCIGIIPCQIFF